mmetsp:Transcript_19851/g.23498  ORF Transcript_19851/g.23498 Transcript_19851/m.23498 type:complete len:106 (-) Transcript_19851:315-632(-)
MIADSFHAEAIDMSAILLQHFLNLIFESRVFCFSASHFKGYLLSLPRSNFFLNGSDLQFEGILRAKGLILIPSANYRSLLTPLRFGESVHNAKVALELGRWNKSK